MDTLRLPPELVEMMTRHASACLPEEACGLLGGRNGTARLVIRVENALHSARAYRMDAVQQWMAFRALDEQGLDLLAIFHSHPQGPAEPSPTDVEQFAYPGVATLILSPAGGGDWQARAFRLDGGNIVEMELRVEAAT